MKKQRGLGKGLDLIFAENTAENGSEAVTIAINDIEPNRGQPRHEFNEEALQELADSIAAHGILQPLLLRPFPDGGYQIVAGERRWRAARMAGLREVPAVIRDLTEQEVMELALIENLQREDLSPLEEAQGYQSLMEQYGFTQEEVAKSVGKSRPVVANALRLLKLPEEVRDMLAEGLITTGHARTLLSFPDEEAMIDAAKQVVAHDLTVRDLERMARLAAKEEKTAAKVPARRLPYYDEVQLALKDYLGRRVKVEEKGKKGTLQIEFYGEEDLAALLEKLQLNK